MRVREQGVWYKTLYHCWKRWRDNGVFDQIMPGLANENLVENIFREWQKTGFAWEQYNPDTGNGQRTQHFTGWTSMVVNMMSMSELAAPATAHDEL